MVESKPKYSNGRSIVYEVYIAALYVVSKVMYEDVTSLGIDVEKFTKFCNNELSILNLFCVYCGAVWCGPLGVLRAQ